MLTLTQGMVLLVTVLVLFSDILVDFCGCDCGCESGFDIGSIDFVLVSLVSDIYNSKQYKVNVFLTGFVFFIMSMTMGRIQGFRISTRISDFTCNMKNAVL